jgi:hypothetical protein
MLIFSIYCKTNFIAINQMLLHFKEKMFMYFIRNLHVFETKSSKGLPSVTGGVLGIVAGGAESPTEISSATPSLSTWKLNRPLGTSCKLRNQH